MLTAGPFRYIKKSDTRQDFNNELYELNQVTLQTLYADNGGKTHVLVYDLNGRVLGFIVFQDVGTHFHLDLAEANRIPESNGINPGTKLIQYVDYVSKLYDYKKITLLALPDLVPYYERLGYKKTGRILYDCNYKLDLAEMEKKLD